MAIQHTAAVLLLGLAAPMAQAFDISGYQYKNGDLFFNVDGEVTQPGCATSESWQYRTSADTADGVMKSLIYQAANSSISVDVTGTGSCLGGVETVRGVFVTNGT